jgi:galactofuranosylgalactofuranosylrhamnosyl-N-acetylglucosaminyl-diphospho-decaprenol beta-1,5/1,6-galactofuranosyltransferase
MSVSKPNVIQTLLWPEFGVATEIDLFMRPKGPVALSYADRKATFESGGELWFDTAQNLFNMGKWQRLCGETDLHLRLRGKGRFELRIMQFFPQRSVEVLFNEPVELSEDEGFRVDLSPMIEKLPAGILIFRLVALEAGALTDATWETTTPPKRLPQLALSITTFKREEAVQATVARFEKFMQCSAFAPYLHLFVVDNGASAEIAQTDHVTPIINRNLGGSGGFSRGLIAAEDRKATHCLFMDDDACIPMEALERTWVFLAYALDTRLAIAGGLTMATNRWAVWENGAVFDGICRPQWQGTDLRNFFQVLDMEFGSTGPKPENFYGGWWFFAFPIEHVEYRAFPFFVRGDDISFSISNRFEIATLPGVMCFQDSDFPEKESPLTVYLIMRSHLVHHLSLKELHSSRVGAMKIPAWFFLRAMIQNHHDTMSALILALSDVLEGPEFFAENADMAKRRADLAAMRKVEAWKPLDGPRPPSRRRFDPRKSHLQRVIFKYSLNGYLLPFFSSWGNSVTLKAAERGLLHEIWGAARITYVSGDGTQFFTVEHSKVGAFKKALRMAKLLLKLGRNFGDIRKTWLNGYRDMTTKDYWEQALERSKSEEKAS